MCFLMSQSYKGSSELHESCGRGDESTKKGACLLEIKRTGMIQWGVSRHIEFIDSVGGNNPQFPPAVVEHEQDPQPPSSIVEHGQKNTQLRKSNPQFPSSLVKEELKVGEAGTESSVLPKAKKRKCHALSEHRESQAMRHAKTKQTSLVYKRKQIKRENSISVKKENVKDRWSVDRYNLAEKSMLDVMKDEGAVFENPISRSALRTVARKRIGDTGLLDHLLKHIDGRVAPGGIERFRRCYNTQGIMEYWLESADLVKIKQEAGVPDPNYVHPSWYRPGNVSQDSVSAKELTLLRDEVAKMKRDMEELVSKNQEQHQANQIGDIYKEFVEWRDKTDQRLKGISNSLGGLQNMYKDVMTWKSKTEQQLKEISNSLSSMQAAKQCTTLNPISERWEDWLESTNLDNIQGEDLAPWLENTDLVNFKHNVSLQEETYNTTQPWLKHFDNPSQEPVCAGELELLKEEMAKMKRDVQELVPKRMEEDQANMTPDSSATANSKSELDNSFSFFQEMFKDLGNWRVKMEQQMLEISNAVNTLQASKQYIT
ncbi:hypothetical protein OIU77_021137 [Salix suchowensis]|uniref:PTC1-like winged helix-turn-helix domain-containing protein n=2 Tax=Salix suchowensis TaxID=1278906 RepID=A0ABQ9C8W2_9ROSI|nr:hypothetical protein OIU77_021137 [Salix suchowensis]